MRLDKFLKVSRILKRRTVANEACDAGRVTVNGKDAKPSHKLKEGDIVCVRFGDKHLTFEVLQLTEHVKKEEAGEMFRVIEE
ncbi:MAG: RNA-binding S4 domain-containing protein [Clostridia bacterium]|nr:RNA-binding S4 domain-containing protein [Clostridia bacterium]